MDTHAASGLPARIAAGALFIALPALVVTANMRVHTVAEPHDNAGGPFGWLIFVVLDVAFCAAFIALGWVPARWALRQVGESALLAKLALLSATWLIAMVPTLGWNAIDAANVRLSPDPARVVKVSVIDHGRWGKAKRRYSVVRERSKSFGSTLLLRSLALEPVGSEHDLRRGDGFFGRPFYLWLPKKRR